MFAILGSARPVAASVARLPAAAVALLSTRTYATETLAIPGVLAAKEPTTDRSTQKTYTVLRTASKNLPVYLNQQRSSKAYTTIIRRIEGSPQDLKKDLQQALELSNDDVKINPVTNHIHIKGHHMAKVKSFCANQGF
ncbi:hypothetical protein BROUX41_002525 [Berkeleyomyces rouxiae]|uniref:uncharacterized protein n=1 Tax=Berkeleyomyces rouxiae TaxID=2035830 RepID=UPI003B7CE5C9